MLAECSTLFTTAAAGVKQTLAGLHIMTFGEDDDTFVMSERDYLTRFPGSKTAEDCESFNVDDGAMLTATSEKLTSMRQVSCEELTHHEAGKVSFASIFVRCASLLSDVCRKDDLQLPQRLTIMQMMLRCDEHFKSETPLDFFDLSHNFGLAEEVRRMCPQADWLHLVALIHDLGKAMLLPGVSLRGAGEAACARRNTLIPAAVSLGKSSCDTAHFETYAIFDEYLFRVLNMNGCTIPHVGLSMVRSLHSSETILGTQFVIQEDPEIQRWTEQFKKAQRQLSPHVDLNIEELIPYYNSLFQKYNIAGPLRWCSE